MNDLIAFLKARIDDDEMWARAASKSRDGEDVPDGLHWRWANRDGDEVLSPEPYADRLLDEQPTEWTSPSLRSRTEFPTRTVGDLPVFFINSAEEVVSGAAGHIARHDPVRVLAEVEAKRNILERHEPFTLHSSRWNPKPVGCGYCSSSPDLVYYPCGDVRAIAAVYAGHPDFREEWIR